MLKSHDGPPPWSADRTMASPAAGETLLTGGRRAEGAS